MNLVRPLKVILSFMINLVICPLSSTKVDTSKSCFSPQYFLWSIMSFCDFYYFIEYIWIIEASFISRIGAVRSLGDLSEQLHNRVEIRVIRGVALCSRQNGLERTFPHYHFRIFFKRCVLVV